MAVYKICPGLKMHHTTGIRSGALTVSYVLLFFVFLSRSVQAVVPQADFSRAAIVDVSEQSETEKAAVQMLIEEAWKRSGIRLHYPQKADQPQIIVGTRNSLHKHPEYSKLLATQLPTSKDGFTVKLLAGEKGISRLFILGNDTRGMLFGVGHFLRKTSFSKGKITVPGTISLSTAPVVATRGHQLGYRPKVNSYDGFTVEMWEQYIRDLAVFGTNAVELLVPFTDDDSDSPMFTLPQNEMLVEMSGLLKKYGLDVWLWYPLMHGDYSKSDVIKKSLRENDSIFKSMPKLDAVFVPGGDPGKQDPDVFFKHMEALQKVLHKHHPKAVIWMSPQGYDAEWMDKFIRIMAKKPKSVFGIVHGPWTRMDVDSLRKIVPADYPIRRYPDITHTIDAQYYVPDWDFAYTVTENRESINPRPLDQQIVFRAPHRSSYDGFISYSEGVNDDVNKMVWSGLGWNPDAPLIEILRDYSRYFIGAPYADNFAHALLGLETNWRGPLLTNPQVYTHHSAFQNMEAGAAPQVKLNWRFQMALYRSYYDAYTRSRLIYERNLEEQALAALREANATGSEAAMNKARGILGLASGQRVAQDWRQRVFELAEALFQSTRMQLSVKKYYAIDTIRGANLDLIDSPLNNRFWLETRFDQISKLPAESQRMAKINEILNWENPGPGGFYDDLGDPQNQSRLIVKGDYAKDPNSFHSAFAGLPGGYSLEMNRIQNWRVSWKTYMQTIYGLPLEMVYENLDADARYQVKVTYVEDVKLKLVANEKFVVHDYLMPEFNPRPVVFDIPAGAINNGRLSLKWHIDGSAEGPGRGCSVAEVWLIKK